MTEANNFLNYLQQIKLLVEEQKFIERFLFGQGYCIICGHSDPLDLEYHHVGGKFNSEFTVSVCRNCHGRLSRKQRIWPKSWMNRNNPSGIKKGFVCQGLADILQLRANRILYNYD